MMNVGAAAEASGVSAKMIRYYEQIGLVAAPRRGANGYRCFDDRDVHTLRFIRRARELGFSTAQIRQLVALWRDRSRPSAEVKRIALEHVADLEAKLEKTRAMRDVLAHLAVHCHGDERPDCPILDELAGSGRRQGRSDSSPVRGFRVRAGEAANRSDLQRASASRYRTRARASRTRHAQSWKCRPSLVSLT